MAKVPKTVEEIIYDPNYKIMEWGRAWCNKCKSDAVYCRYTPVYSSSNSYICVRCDGRERRAKEEEVGVG